MNIVVTGSAGYIGSCLCEELLTDPRNSVVGIDNYVNSSINVHKKLKSSNYDRFEYISMDISNHLNYENVKDTLLSLMSNIDVIIHCAGLKIPNDSLSQPYKYYDNNHGCTEFICELARELSIDKIIFSSTAGLYDINEKYPYVEECKCIPITPYAYSKLISENILKSYSDMYGINVICLRYFNPVGCHRSYNYGDPVDAKPINLMSHILAAADNKIPVLSIYGKDYDTKDGTCIRDFIHIMDLLRGHIKAIYSNLKGFNCINLGTGEGTSVLEMVTTFSEVNKVKLNYEFVPRRSNDIPISIADISKAKNLLDYAPVYTLEDMCKDSYTYYFK